MRGARVPCPQVCKQEVTGSIPVGSTDEVPVLRGFLSRQSLAEAPRNQIGPHDWASFDPGADHEPPSALPGARTQHPPALTTALAPRHMRVGPESTIASAARGSPAAGRPGDRSVAIAIIGAPAAGTIALPECDRRAASISWDRRWAPRPQRHSAVAMTSGTTPGGSP